MKSIDECNEIGRIICVKKSLGSGLCFWVRAKIFCLEKGSKVALSLLILSPLLL